MGASSWCYDEVYGPSLRECLSSVLSRAFDQGDYYRAWRVADQTFDPGVELEDLIAQRVAMGAPCFQGLELDELLRTRRPATYQQLLYLNLHDGLHSILDCPNTSDRPEPHAVAPFSSAELLEVLGTSEPTTEMLRGLAGGELFDRFEEHLERDCGRYLVSYHDGAPDRYWFFGYSGD